jgi:molybdopterin-guanine dinucleotide biosynthesis protein MobB
VKHAAHGFVIDRPGSDTSRVHDAGAVVTVITGPRETALRIASALPEPERVVRLAVQAARATWGTSPDCVLMEGFRHPGRPVIQVGPQKPDAEFGEVWATVPALADLDSASLDAELERVAEIVRRRLAGS